MSEASARPLLYVITGMSGSGKSVALNTLEDLDFFCTDNLPAELLPRFVRSVASDNRGRHRLAERHVQCVDLIHHVGSQAQARLLDLAVSQFLSRRKGQQIQ